jgi:hypothetical protein
LSKLVPKFLEAKDKPLKLVIPSLTDEYDMNVGGIGWPLKNLKILELIESLSYMTSTGLIYEIVVLNYVSIESS